LSAVFLCQTYPRPRVGVASCAGAHYGTVMAVDHLPWLWQGQVIGSPLSLGLSPYSDGKSATTTLGTVAKPPAGNVVAIGKSAFRFP